MQFFKRLFYLLMMWSLCCRFRALSAVRRCGPSVAAAGPCQLPDAVFPLLPLWGRVSCQMQWSLCCRLWECVNCQTLWSHCCRYGAVSAVRRCGPSVAADGQCQLPDAVVPLLPLWGRVSCQTRLQSFLRSWHW